jgi:hypothetical protein
MLCSRILICPTSLLSKDTHKKPGNKNGREESKQGKIKQIRCALAEILDLEKRLNRIVRTPMLCWEKILVLTLVSVDHGLKTRKQA